MNRHPVRALMILLLVVAAGAWSARAQSTVSISKTIRGGPGTDLAVPINVNPATGVTAMDFHFAYDATVLTPTGVYRTGFANAFIVSHDFSTAGAVTISMSSGTALSGTGDVCWVVFRVIGASGTFSNLTWTSAVLNNGSIPVTTSDGKITIASTAAIVSMPDNANGTAGTSVTVPISVVPADGGEAFDLAVAFNPNVISAVSVSKTALSAPLTLTYNVALPGEVRISLFGTAPITGSGPIVNITFNVVGSLGNVTPLDVFRGDINERAISTALDDGLFTICSSADSDHDGYSGCAGDCDDSDPSVHPGATELCDGKDNNCNGSVDEGFDVGAACSAGLGICQRSGSKVCTNDGSGTVCNAVPGPSATEVCNGLDDDCDGVVDNHIAVPPERPNLSAASVTPTTISWTAASSAQTYDLQKGALKLLLSSGLTSATTVCLANDTLQLSATDSGRPVNGDGFWYVVRPSNCAGHGTFNDGSETTSRDSSIAASPNACP